jgi:hypothetical protein
MTISCYFLHGSDHRCLLRRLEPTWTCKDRRANNVCGLVAEDEKRPPVKCMDIEG